MTVAIFIVGPPAAGKTTFARTLIGAASTLIAKPKWTLSADGLTCAAGHYTGDTFDGADRVGYNQVSDSLLYWGDHLQPRVDVTIFDGDRFSFESCVNFVRAGVEVVRCIYVTASDDVLAARRAARNWTPNPTWLKGRATKAKRFTGLFKSSEIEEVNT